MDFNVAPYFDDYDSSRDFLKILFRPGYGIQARELTQLQTILQEQISRYGRYTFREGAPVVGAQIVPDVEYHFAKIQGAAGSPIGDAQVAYLLQQMQAGRIIRAVEVNDANGETGFSAKLINIASHNIADTTVPESERGPLTFYFKYDQGGVKKFTSRSRMKLVLDPMYNEAGVLVEPSYAFPNNAAPIFFAVRDDSTTAIPTPNIYDATPVGIGSAVSVTEGIRFVNGYFVRVNAQTIILERYNNKPTTKAGLRIVESIITPEQDATLLDNAQGSPNYTAPGAHRYNISLILTKIPVDTSSGMVIDPENPTAVTQADPEVKDFIGTTSFESGKVAQQQDSENVLNTIETALAERLYDQSGDFIVDPFEIVPQEYLKEGSNGGRYAPTDTQNKYRNDADKGESKMVLNIDSGRAYVGGYLIKKFAESITLEKARETRAVQNAGIFGTIGNYTYIRDITGFPYPYSEINLKNAGGDVIGKARVIYADIPATMPTGSLGGIPQARLFLADIRMGLDNAGRAYKFADARTYENTFVPSGETGAQGGQFIRYGTPAVATIFDQDKAPLARRFGFTNIKDTSDISFSVYRTFAFARNANTNQNIVLTVNNPSTEAFASNEVYVFGVSGTGDSTQTRLTGVNAGSSLTIVGDSLPQSSTYRIVALVDKSEATKRTKTKVGPITETVELIKEGNVWKGTLVNSDVIEVLNIKSAGTERLADFNTFDGRSDGFYGRGYIVQKPGTAAIPIDVSDSKYKVQVTYSYYQHGSSGDYFSVDSYVDNVDANPQAYKAIPDFNGSNGSSFNLRDAMDFRPSTSFERGNFSQFEVIAPSFGIRADLTHYLPRIDKLVMDRAGNYKVIEGSASINPVAPDDENGSMTIAVLVYPPFTADARDVTVNLYEHKRFLFKDIANIEKRVQRLEYYSSLSLLERNASERQYKDTDDIDRFKAGFLVDDFSNQSASLASDNDYSCSTDLVNGELRPIFTSDAVDLEMVTAFTVDTSTGEDDNEIGTTVMTTGKLVTLPYEEVSVIEQSQASRPMNVNPYDVFSWDGSIDLDPASDIWKDTDTRPSIVVQNDQFSAVAQLARRTGALNTVWNEWQDVWSGRPSVVGQSTRLTAWGWGDGLRQWTTTTVSAQQVGQRRTGIQNTVVPNTTTQNLGDRVVSIGVIPFIRARNVTIRATRMKPNTTVYAFFDGINVTSFCSPSTMVTDANGALTATFTIPNNETVRFRTGQRKFKLTDDSEDRDNFATTTAEAIYTAEGTLETHQSTVLSTRVAEFRTIPLVQGRQITRWDVNTSTVTQRVNWGDPLAQSFLVDQNGGMFVTGIDLFFAKKPRGSVTPPVTVELHEMSNGYPTQTVLPFGRATVNAEDVETSTNGTVATRFQFPSPVYLKQGSEYAFVVMANSTEYEVFVSRLGEDDIITGQRITKQPYAGVMFKSQNSSTWTAEQLEDMKFTMYKAQFNTESPVRVHIRNKPLEDQTLDAGAFQFVGNTIDGPTVTPVFRVYQPDHGLVAGSKVEYTGVTQNMFGIQAADWNSDTNPTTPTIFTVMNTLTGSTPIYAGNTTSFDVVNPRPDRDHYYITFSGKTAVGSVDAFSGNAGIKATREIRMNVAQPIISTLKVSGTGMDWSVLTTSRVVTENLSYVGYVKDTDEQFVSIEDNITFTNHERAITSPLNEWQQLSDALVVTRDNRTRGFEMFCTMYSDNPNVSPVIDLDRFGMVVVGNVINNNKYDDAASTPREMFEGPYTVNPKTTFVATQQVASFPAGTFIVADGLPTSMIAVSGPNTETITAAAHFDWYTDGTYTTIASAVPADGSGYLKIKATSPNVTGIISGSAWSGGGTLEAVIEKPNQFSVSGFGWADAKYVTREVTLIDPATTLKVIVDANIPPNADIEVYARLRRAGDARDISQLPYEHKLKLTKVPEKTDDTSSFEEYEFTTWDADQPTGEEDNVGEFVAFSIKIVMYSDNTASIPRLTAFRAISLN